jgi:hypothetical protein
MAGPLTFLLPPRYDRARAVLLVQSAAIELALEVAARLRSMFPDCELDGLVGEADREAAARGSFHRVLTVRWEDRFEVVRSLRRRRYDIVVVLLSKRGSDYLRMLPFLLRTRSILVFNDHLDHFPLHATRLGALAHHLSGRHSIAALLLWTVARAVLLPFATLVLVASVLRLYARAAWRNRRHKGDGAWLHDDASSAM